MIRMEMGRIVRIAVRCMLVLLCAACINENEPVERGDVDLVAGDPVPDFAVRMDDGTTITRQTLAGKPALILFFHTDCPDCRQELPVVQRFYELHGTQVRVVTISRAQGVREVAAYWSAHGLTLPYSAQEDAAVYHLFADTGIPRVYAVDANGVIRSVFKDDPPASYEELVAAFSALE